MKITKKVHRNRVSQFDAQSVPELLVGEKNLIIAVQKCRWQRRHHEMRCFYLSYEI